ncbi:HD-GYP domain-containing protein [Bacillus sp. REN3]|uniref:HD-GYP domain-containing protein n=1 Tax=Bacillus sp. REN3 TaxID=2802440 RepID=UPI001AED17D7|nr:HD-GYP domain-containing protein [Bacillus sp. REN3]
MFSEIKTLPLENEEQRALKWFLMLFYLIYVFYEVFYHLFYKNIDLHLPRDVNIWMYIALLLLLPVSIIMAKKGKLYWIKYFFVTSYIVISIINETLIYTLNTLEYQSGNAVEILLILFSPFFVNKNFFLLVTSSLLFKYGYFGVLLQTKQVLAPIALVIILSGIAFILLKRFESYISSIRLSYDNQLSAIVKGVIATIELKDPYTRGHSERVAFYANSLAKETERFSLQELESFNKACLLHDIGKVSIPDSILMKPGKLTNEEFDIIKTHPSVGAEAIKRVKGLADSVDIIKSHHERWDGKGYPDQLQKEHIPYLARVISIADAFDAMTSSRSYREALPVEEAYKRILEGQGTQFDPQLVEVFKKVYPKWVDFHNTHKWSENLSITKSLG